MGSRRTFLQGLGFAAVSLAGCLDRVAPVDGTERQSDTPSVSNLRLRKMVVFDAGIWGTVRAADGQFLVADVGGFADDTYQYPLGVKLDGQRVTPDDETPFRRTVPVSPDQPPTDPESIDDSAAAMAVPARPVERGAVIEPGLFGRRWPLPDDILRDVDRPPVFDLRSFETSFEGLRDVALTVRVANTGRRDGLWLGQVSHDRVEDASEVFGVRVPVGETVERTVVPDILSQFGPGETVTVEFRSTTEVSREVTIPE